MDERNRHRICPVERAGSLDLDARKWFQNPEKLLKPHIREGMTVIDLGCGPGFFTVPMAVMVGPRGRVIAIDLQEGMLEKLRHKIAGTDLEPRITLQKSEATRIGPTAPVDFVLAFYMVHEVPDREGLFSQIASVMRPGGRLLAVEPPFHVSTAAFDETIRQAGMAGLRPVNRPKVLFSKAILLQKV